MRRTHLNALSDFIVALSAESGKDHTPDGGLGCLVYGAAPVHLHERLVVVFSGQHFVVWVVPDHS